MPMPTTEEGLVEKIYETVSSRGPSAHNLIGLLLRKLATINEERANELFEELQ